MKSVYPSCQRTVFCCVTLVGGDVSHLNLYKPFCIPHSGVGPVCVAADLVPYLPGRKTGAQASLRCAPSSSLPLPPGEGGGYALRLQKRLRASGQRVEGRAQPGQRSARQGSPSPVGAISAALLGNAAVLPISWMHCRMMGAEELQQATEIAILSANYVSARLKQASSPCTQAGPLRDVATSRTSASSIYARSRSAAA